MNDSGTPWALADTSGKPNARFAWHVITFYPQFNAGPSLQTTRWMIELFLRTEEEDIEAMHEPVMHAA